MSKDVNLCFIDFAKAFDNVKHEKLIEVLRNAAIDGKDIRIIANMYWSQTAKIKVDNLFSGEIAVRMGVRQGCILSPLLFNIYSEQIFEKALAELSDDIRINGESVNNIRYADDTVIIANNNEELQSIMQNVYAASEEYGLSLNISKTKHMILARINILRYYLTINGQNIEQVETYTYLGTTVNAKWDQTSEIRSRIERARAAFNNMKKLFTSKDISPQLKLRLVRC